MCLSVDGSFMFQVGGENVCVCVYGGGVLGRGMCVCVVECEGGNICCV